MSQDKRLREIINKIVIEWIGGCTCSEDYTKRKLMSVM